jgi:tetratricopeptide (TPR) repeat protein
MVQKVDICYSSIWDWKKCQTQLILASLFGIGQIQYISEDYSMALESFNLAFSYIEFHMGTSSLEAAACLNCIGVVHNMMIPISDYGLEALTIANNIRVALLGATHNDVGTTWNSIGDFYNMSSMYDKALVAYKAAHRIRRASERGSMNYALTLCNIGLMYCVQGLTDNALTHFQIFIRITKDKLKEDDWLVLILCGCSGIILLGKGDFKNGLKMFQRFLIFKHIKLGKAYKQILCLLGTYGEVFLEKGEMHNALTSYKEMLQIATDCLEPSDESILDIQESIAKTYELMKDFIMAHVYWENAMAWQIKFEYHPCQIAVTMASMSYIKYKLGDDINAITMFDKSLDTLRATNHTVFYDILLLTYEKCITDGPDESLYTALCMMEIGMYKFANGDVDQGLQLVSQAARIQSQQNDPNSPLDLSKTYRKLGKLYNEIGELTPVRNSYHVALQIIHQANEVDKHACAEIWNDIGNIELQLGNVEELMKCFTMALRFYKMIYQGDDNQLIVGLPLWRFDMISPHAASVA